MQEAVPVGVGAMAAIIGLESNDVIDCCKEASQIGIVEPANFNCPGQIVVAGETEAVEKAVELCNAKGAMRAMLLPVSAPFHCSLLKPAGEKLAVELEKVTLNDIKIPVITNVTGDVVTEKDIVKELLIKQVSTSVLWEKCIRTMLSEGVATFVEIGPGKVLSGFVKKIDRSVKVINVENLKTLDNAFEILA